MTTTTRQSGAHEAEAAPVRPPLLSIVVPVFNGGEEIVGNVGEIRRAAAGELRPEDVEIVVVSDGSLDGTAERLLAARSDVDMRVIHYDRNLGKGYAVKLGALATTGEWIALVDADLDLDPSVVPAFLETARREQLDFAIGSKRHPESVVDYPRSRRLMSWGYQRLNRVLFGLDVSDTQVGLKVFSRAVADEVIPLLLVKRFVFDLELLAVAKAIGRGRIRELPVRLEYRFSGSSVGWRAVARALVDTAAVFHRLRILRTYQRKRRLVRAPARRLGAEADVLTVVSPGARPASNWLTAAAPYFERPDVAAVVVPTMAPPDASPREQAAAAVLESRLGGGSRRSSVFPGNVRVTADYPTESAIVRARDWQEAQEASVPVERLAAWLAERGRLTVYTPDAIIVAAPPPLFRPHLRATLAHARSRGSAARRSRARSLSGATALSLLPAGCAAAGVTLAVGGSSVGPLIVGAYGALVGGSAALAGLRFRSARVAALTLPGLLATQAVYVGGFVAGALRGT